MLDGLVDGGVELSTADELVVLDGVHQECTPPAVLDNVFSTTICTNTHRRAVGSLVVLAVPDSDPTRRERHTHVVLDQGHQRRVADLLVAGDGPRLPVKDSRGAVFWSAEIGVDLLEDRDHGVLNRLVDGDSPRPGHYVSHAPGGRPTPLWRVEVLRLLAWRREPIVDVRTPVFLGLSCLVPEVPNLEAIKNDDVFTPGNHQHEAEDLDVYLRPRRRDLEEPTTHFPS